MFKKFYLSSIRQDQKRRFQSGDVYVFTEYQFAMHCLLEDSNNTLTKAGEQDE